MAAADRLLVIGGGQAGYQTCASLRAEGYEGAIILASEEPEPPYQRPPLSKGYLTGEQGPDDLPFRGNTFYEDQRIDLRLGDPVMALDLRAKRATTKAGHGLDFDRLVLATGASPKLPPIEGHDLDGVMTLRTHADAQDLKARLADGGSLAVIGGGFIGLEVAAAAVKLGCKVSVIEMQDRVMGRVTAPVVGQYFQDLHARMGVDLRLQSGVARILSSDGRAAGLELSDGSRIKASVIVVGIGVTPCEALAAAAGLDCQDGILVDATLTAGHPEVFAIGDCARFPSPYAEGRVRLESVQNAADQAKAIARAVVGTPEDYTAVPWFWTQQFGKRLQMAGLSQGYDAVAVRGSLEADKFSAFYYRGGRLAAVDSLDSPADHIAARMMIAEGLTPSPEIVGDQSIRLKDWAKTALETA